MTITYLGEQHAPATNNRGNRSYSRVFHLKTSQQTESAYDVGSHASLPAIGEVHPDDADAWCEVLRVDPTAPWKGWTVTAEYSTERELSETPTSDPAYITWGSEQFQRPAIFDNSGDLIVNSAGDPFDPPNMMDDSRRTVTIEKNLSSVPSWILTYQDAVNNGAFTVDGITIGTGLAKMQSVIVGPVQLRNATAFRTVTFTIHLQKSGWLMEPLDAGFRENIAGVMSNIKNDGDDELPSAPVPLDGAGAVLADPSPTNAVTLSFSVYELKNFSALPLT